MRRWRGGRPLRHRPDSHRDPRGTQRHAETTQRDGDRNGAWPDGMCLVSCSARSALVGGVRRPHAEHVRATPRHSVLGARSARENQTRTDLADHLQCDTGCSCARRHRGHCAALVSARRILVSQRCRRRQPSCAECAQGPWIRESGSRSPSAMRPRPPSVAPMSVRSTALEADYLRGRMPARASGSSSSPTVWPYPARETRFGPGRTMTAGRFRSR